MKKKFEFVNNDGRKLSLSGISLLRLIHEVVQNTIAQYCDKEKQKENPLKVNNGQFWIDIIGHLTTFHTSHDYSTATWLDCKITINNAKEITVIKKNNGELVKFPDDKHSYEDITEKLREILKKYKFTHSILAEVLLSRVAAADYPSQLNSQTIPWQDKDKEFLDALIILMFGVESSRNNTTLLSSLLLLDLIQHNQVYGSRNTPFNWENAFVSRYDYHWDDFEYKNYGGKYPMSSQSTGSGNLGKGKPQDPGVLKYGRGDIFVETMPNFFGITDPQMEKSYCHTESFLEEQFNEYPQRHGVPRREISLVVHWLESLTSDNKKLLAVAKDETDLKEKISQLLETRLIHGYQLEKNLQRTLFIENSTNKKFIPLQTYHLKDLSSTPINLTHQNSNKESSKHILLHRPEVTCKLIPGWVAKGEEKTLYTNDKIKGNINRFWSNKSSKDEFFKCVYCYSRPLEITFSRKTNPAQLVLVDNKKTIHQLNKNETCTVRSKIDTRTISSDKLTDTTAQLTFFGQATKENNKKCEQCFPDESVDQIKKEIKELKIK